MPNSYVNLLTSALILSELQNFTENTDHVIKYHETTGPLRYNGMNLTAGLEQEIFDETGEVLLYTIPYATYEDLFTRDKLLSNHPEIISLGGHTEQAVLYVSPYPDAVGSANPSSYWRLGESSGATAVDSAGSANGTYANVSYGELGAVGDVTDTSILFNGSSSEVVMPASVDTSTPHAFELWVRPTSGILSEKLVQLGIPGVNFSKTGISIQSSSLKIRYFAYDTSNTQIHIESADSLILNAWNHIYVERDNLDVAIYINKNVSTGVFIAPASFTSTELTVGRGESTGGAPESFFTGGIDEVAFYQSTLSIGVIYQHFSSGQVAGGTNYAVPVSSPVDQDSTAGNRLIGLPLLIAKKNLDLTDANIVDYDELAVDIRHALSLEVRALSYNSTSRILALGLQEYTEDYEYSAQVGDPVVISRRIYDNPPELVTIYGETLQYEYGVYEMTGVISSIVYNVVEVTMDNNGYLDNDILNCDLICPVGQTMTALHLGRCSTSGSLGGASEYQSTSVGLGYADWTYCFENRTAEYTSRIPAIKFNVPRESGDVVLVDFDAFKIHLNIFKSSILSSDPIGFTITPIIYR